MRTRNEMNVRPWRAPRAIYQRVLHPSAAPTSSTVICPTLPRGKFALRRCASLAAVTWCDSCEHGRIRTSAGASPSHASHAGVDGQACVGSGELRARTRRRRRPRCCALPSHGWRIAGRFNGDALPPLVARQIILRIRRTIGAITSRTVRGGRPKVTLGLCRRRRRSATSVSSVRHSTNVLVLPIRQPASPRDRF